MKRLIFIALVLISFSSIGQNGVIRRTQTALVDTLPTHINRSNWDSYIQGLATGTIDLVDYFNVTTDDTDDITEGGTNLFYTELRVSANTDVTANTAKVTNATHTGEVTGATALTVASDVIDYDNVSDDLKQEVTDNDGNFDMNGSGIINAAISTNTTFSFSNINPTRSIALEVVVTSSATITWNTTPKDIRGDALSGDGTYLIHIFSWGTTEGDLEITVKAL